VELQHGLQASGPKSSELLLGLAAAPQKFCGRTGSSPEAIAAASRNLEVFLKELESYFELCCVPEARSHALAVGFLAGDAKLNYSVQAGAERSAGRSVDMVFFQSTLRTAYIPPAQSALVLYNWHNSLWAASAMRGTFMADTYLARFEESLAAVRRLPPAFQPAPAWQCQVLLSGLPDDVRSLVRLNNRNEPHVDVDGNGPSTRFGWRQW
jgi:hypothetical protein